MNGILLFDKPFLWTSHDAVDFLRRKIGQKSVGHAGTLDPMATGLLVLLIGKATKQSDEFMGLDKDYRGVMTLGVTTDTLDFEGKILSQSPCEMVLQADVRRVFSGLTGDQLQTPPMYSAVKKSGKKLYEYARAGAVIQAEARKITVSRFDLLAFYPPDAHFFLTGSKGTYVRSLVRDAGERLGPGAALSALRRERIGRFYLKNAKNRETIEKATSAEIESFLVS